MNRPRWVLDNPEFIEGSPETGNIGAHRRPRGRSRPWSSRRSVGQAARLRVGCHQQWRTQAVRAEFLGVVSEAEPTWLRSRSRCTACPRCLSRTRTLAAIH